MPFNTQLAARVRTYLDDIPDLQYVEKKMFGGLAFLVNGKMCVNVSSNNLMCRFDPELEQELAGKTGFQPMIMRGKQLRGYCYVSEEGYKTESDFKYWLDRCLDFNERA